MYVIRFRYGAVVIKSDPRVAIKGSAPCFCARGTSKRNKCEGAIFGQVPEAMGRGPLLRSVRFRWPYT